MDPLFRRSHAAGPTGLLRGSGLSCLRGSLGVLPGQPPVQIQVLRVSGLRHHHMGRCSLQKPLNGVPGRLQPDEGAGPGVPGEGVYREFSALPLLGQPSHDHRRTGPVRGDKQARHSFVPLSRIPKGAGHRPAVHLRLQAVGAQGRLIGDQRDPALVGLHRLFRAQPHRLVRAVPVQIRVHRPHGLRLGAHQLIDNAGQLLLEDLAAGEGIAGPPVPLQVVEPHPVPQKQQLTGHPAPVPEGEQQALPHGGGHRPLPAPGQKVPIPAAELLLLQGSQHLAGLFPGQVPGIALPLLRRPLGPAGHLHRAGQWKHRPE